MEKYWILWFSVTQKVLSLKVKQGFDVIEVKTKEEYWKKVYTLLETGYRVQ